MIRDVAFGNKSAFLHDLMCVTFKAQATNLHMVCDISSHTTDDSIKPIQIWLHCFETCHLWKTEQRKEKIHT